MSSNGSAQGPRRRSGQLAWRISDSLAERAESWKALEPLGRTVGGWFSSIVRPGPLKDLLAGTWQSHPLHPMLTDVPIGAWTSALLLDLLGGAERHRAADSLIGIGVLAALPTAVTGLNELADTEDGGEVTIMTAHGVGNVAAVTLYGLSYVFRRGGARRLGTVLSLAGAGVMTGSGFLGGHLSFRKGIGVNRTAFEPPVRRWTAVLDEAELPEGEARKVSVGGADVLVLRRGDRVLSLANRCSHRGGPLHKGTIEGLVVQCPWHHSRFDLEDGSVLQGPATAPQPAFEARIENGKVEVRSRR
jgi:nitrite reductase/ring-hydroxylating ferredoxin subunit/uncharacterized membrane protein